MVFSILWFVFLVYKSIHQGQRKILSPAGHKIFPDTCIISSMWSFQKVVLDSQKLSESIISVVALLFLKDRTNSVFSVTILTSLYLQYVLVLEQGNKIPFFPVSKIFRTFEMHVFHLHSTYLRIGSFILPVVNQILFPGI